MRPARILQWLSTSSRTEIHGPFLKSGRRERREFSEEDDKNLLKGFKRYGPIWHKMRDDFEFEVDRSYVVAVASVMV